MMVYISLSSCYCFCFLEYLSQLTATSFIDFSIFHISANYICWLCIITDNYAVRVFPSANPDSFLYIDLASRDFIFCLRIYLPCLRLRRTLCLTVGALSASQSQASVESQRPIRSQLTLTVGLCLAVADFCLIWGEPGQRLFLPFLQFTSTCSKTPMYGRKNE